MSASKKPLWGKRYNDPDTERIRQLTRQVNKEDSLTNQADTPGTDLNLILKRTTPQELLMGQNPFDPALFGDLPDNLDLQSMMDHTVKARDEFMKLPADVRRKFDNNEGQMYRYLHDPDNWEEAEKLGLIKLNRKEKAHAGVPDGGTDQAPRGGGKPPESSAGKDTGPAQGSQSGKVT